MELVIKAYDATQFWRTIALKFADCFGNGQ